MKETLYILALNGLVLIASASAEAQSSGPWQAPFDTNLVEPQTASSELSLDDVLSLVAAKNPTLRAISYKRQAAEGRLKQAGVWSNPELGFEIEDVGWDAPGLTESEISVSLAQEFEFFGQRQARRAVALAEIDNVGLQARLSAYDLYLETKRRFYALAHAQKHLGLSAVSVDLARTIVENISFRIGKGAALQSEQLLAQLEEQRAQLRLDESGQDLEVARIKLAALWNGTPTDITLTFDPEPQLDNLLDQVGLFETGIDSTRNILQLDRQAAILLAEQSLATAEARPSVTLSGGYKRIEANNSNSLLFGLSMPLPFFNRNQGRRESLGAELRSLEYDRAQVRLEAAARIRSGAIELRQAARRHETLDTVLLPTAEEAYRMLHAAYLAGRVTYTHLLEAERSLNEIRFEHNHLLLTIHKQIIALESFTGVTMRLDHKR
jgi:cobalt-zinc-cadmium efflux system outer membrane protein